MARRGLERLTGPQRTRLVAWLGDIAVLDDLSWDLVDTTVLHVASRDGDVIVKASGPTDHHLGRELVAHREFTGPWVRAGLAARLLHGSVDLNLLVTEYLPGRLAMGSPAEGDPGTHRQAGAALRILHDQRPRPDAAYDADEVAYSLALLDTPHRIDEESVHTLRSWLQAYVPRPVTLVPTHGDWQPRNWLVDGRTLRVIDFGRADWRPAQTDLCRLAGRDWRGRPDLEAAFVEGYGDDPRDATWPARMLREAIGTATWAYRVGDLAFEEHGHRLIADAVTRLVR